MSLDYGFGGQTQTGTDVWGGASAGTGLFGQTGHAPPAPEAAVTVGKDETGSGSQPAAKDALKNQPGGQANSPPPYYPSREQLVLDVQKDPSKFNLPPGMPPEKFAQQYFNEFVAKLAGKQPYAMDAQGNQLPYDPKAAGQVWTPQEKEMLTKWGYNADVPKGNIADDNAKSGLYALRIDPIKGGDAPPIIAFRGTEPTAGPQDLQSDLGGKYVGQSQYEGNAKLINDRLTRAGDKNVDVVGYSLGGALAQKYTADHVAQVGQLSTYQAPGISQTDADKFKQGNADHHVDVNHFYNDADIVHRAGEAKLDGNFTQVKNPNWGAKDIASLHPHLSSILCNSNSDFEGAVGQNNIKTYDKDQQTDRKYWEGARQLLGPAASNALGAGWAPVTSGIGDVGKGVGDVKKGGSELAQGTGDLIHNPLKGAGEIGHGVWDATKGVGESLWGGAKVVGGLGAAVATGVGTLEAQALQGGANLVKKGWDGAKTLASNAGQAVVNGVSNAGHAVVDGVSNFAHAAGDKISSAGHAIANTASNVISGAGTAISNGASAVKKFLHLPW